MPGFPLAAIGAGLGQWANYMQQQQAQRERQQRLEIALATFAQQQQDRRDQLQKAALQWGLKGAGDAGAGPAPNISPIGGGFPSSGTMPAAPLPMSGRDLGGGLRAGGALDAGRFLDLAEQKESGGRNIMQGVVPPGGGYNPSVGRVTGPSTAQGYFQITNSTWRDNAPRAGVDLAQYPTAMSAPREVQRKVAESVLETQGPGAWTNYNPALKAAVGGRSIGGGGETQMAQAGPPTATDAAPLTAPPPDLRQRLNKVLPPDLTGSGKLTEGQLKAAIDQQMPGANPIVKLQALEAEMKRLAPIEQERLKLKMEQYRSALDAETKVWEKEQAQYEWDRRHRITQAEELAKEQRTGGTIKTGPGGEQFNVQGAGARPIIRSDTGEPLTDVGKPGKTQLLEYTAEDGKIERVEAQQMPNGQWVTADQLRAPIDVSKGKWSIVPASQASAMGASRDAQQRERQLISAREVISDLQNAVELPVTTTRGIFGGRTQGPGLMDALKENLAEKLTSEDAELVNSALSGLARELSIIVSPVYGGKWAAESFGALTLKEGQTNNVKLYNLARMRQTADNALEAMTKSPRIGEAQKEYAAQMRDMLDKAVPWTPSDVIAYRKQGDDRQTFRQFVQERGIGGAKGFPPEAVEMLRQDKRPDAQQQFDAIFGPGAAAKALGGGGAPAAAPGAM